MVIYDKNQFSFNVIFTIILISSLFLNIYYATNFKVLNDRLLKAPETIFRRLAMRFYRILIGLGK